MEMAMVVINPKRAPFSATMVARLQNASAFRRGHKRDRTRPCVGTRKTITKAQAAGEPNRARPQGGVTTPNVENRTVSLEGSSGVSELTPSAFLVTYPSD